MGDMKDIMAITDHGKKSASENSLQFTTFYVAGRLYGVDVIKVQEVVKPMPMTTIPLAPHYLTGLINLRGQIATGIGMRELFDLPKKKPEELMNVVCKVNGIMLSFQVDEIGDVLEVKREQFESLPTTISESVRRFLGGVYKVNNQLLCVIDIEPIASFMGLAGGQSPERASS